MFTLFLNSIELSALRGLPHLQRLIYTFALRPYVDTKTNIIGKKRGISYQSIAEELYVEPHKGIKATTTSKDQIRRALKGLERAGLIKIISSDWKLIIECLLLNQDFSVQNKAATYQPCKVATKAPESKLDFIGSAENIVKKLPIEDNQKAAIPLNNNNLYIYLCSQFEKFWTLYPEKKSKDEALAAFITLNPDEALFNTIITALENQIAQRTILELEQQWLPSWKYPATWLTKRCWLDEVKTIVIGQEKHYAKRSTLSRKHPNPTTFWIPEEELNAQSCEFDNVIQLIPK